MTFFNLISKFLRINTLLILLIAISYSCSRGNPHEVSSEKPTKRDTVYIERFRADTIFVHDTIVNEVEVVKFTSGCPPMFDSIETQELLDCSIWSNLIDPHRGPIYLQSDLNTRTDMEYLPYLLSLCSDYNKPITDRTCEVFVSLCTECINDKRLFDLGKTVVDKINSQVVSPFQKIEYPDEFTKGGMFTYQNFKWFEPTAIDTLRVRVVAHNDREALKKLEKYYQDKNDGLGLAIYYKVLLGYEGNGDLAEKFYHTLEPYFEETPQFRSAVREVLLRAALCDHNERAQQLCDSLGFSLCDYRLPHPN